MLKNRLAYIFFLAVSGWLMIMYEGYYMAVIFRAVLILPALFLVINFLCTVFLSVDFINPEAEAEVGDYIRIGMTVKNRVPVPVQKMAIHYTVTDNLGKNKKEVISTNLKMFERADMYIQLGATGARAGNVTINKIYIYDFLGLFRNRHRFKQAHIKYYIYPTHHESNIIVDTQIIETDDGVVYSTVRPGNDRTELFAIRDYREGDDVRNIHWKLSVKRDDILVKEYSLPIRQDITLIFDLLENPACGREEMYVPLNRYFELLHSISTHLISLQCLHHIYVSGNAGKYMYISDGDDRDVAEKTALSSCKCEGTEYAKKELMPDALRGSVIYVSTGLDAMFLREAAAAGRIKKLVIMCIGKDTDEHVKEACLLAEEMSGAGYNAEFVLSDISGTIEEMQVFTI